MPITIKCEYCKKEITGILNLAKHYQDFHLEDCRKDYDEISQINLNSIQYVKSTIIAEEYIN